MLKSSAFQDWLSKKYDVQLVAKNKMIVSHPAEYEYIYALDIIMFIKCNELAVLKI